LFSEVLSEIHQQLVEKKPMVERSKQIWTEASEPMQYMHPEEMHSQYCIVSISLGKAVVVCV